MDHPYGIVWIFPWSPGFAIRPVGMVHFVETTGIDRRMSPVGTVHTKWVIPTGLF